MSVATVEDRLLSIISDHVKTGERLPTEKQMVEELGISRATLREMLSQYESVGLLQAQRGSGRYAKMPNVITPIVNTWKIALHANPSMLLELLEIRRLLEIGSLPKAVNIVTGEQLQYLNMMVQQMLELAERNESFVHQDREFHRTMFISTGNSLLEQMLTAFWDLFEAADFNKKHDNLMLVAVQHEKILVAFSKQQLDELTLLMNEQFTDARYRITFAYGTGQ